MAKLLVQNDFVADAVPILFILNEKLILYDYFGGFH